MDDEVLIEAYISYGTEIFKNLVDLLWRITPIKRSSKNVGVSKQAILRIDKNGIVITVDHQNCILANIVLRHENLSKYYYNYTEKELSIGISLNPLKDFFNDVQKNKNIVLRVKKESGVPSVLDICINDETNDFIKGYSISITNEQNIHILANQESELEINQMTPEEFTNLCKSMGSKNNIINIDAKNTTVVFSKCSIPGMDVSWISYKTLNKTTFSNSVRSELFKSISKLSSFKTPISIYINNADVEYLIFRTAIVNNFFKKQNDAVIGTISIWIKTETKVKKIKLIEQDLTSIF